MEVTRIHLSNEVIIFVIAENLKKNNYAVLCTLVYCKQEMKVDSQQCYQDMQTKHIPPHVHLGINKRNMTKRSIFLSNFFKTPSHYHHMLH